jgi:hypothetical protein
MLLNSVDSERGEGILNQCKTCSAPCPECGGSRDQTVKTMLLEHILRQAAQGVAWRQVCIGPMQFLGVTPEDIEAEINRREHEQE